MCRSFAPVCVPTEAMDNFMVSLRGPSAKQFWDGMERFGEQLEELGGGDKAKNV